MLNILLAMTFRVDFYKIALQLITKKGIHEFSNVSSNW